ncbi:MAG: XRE family transcriptional regulator [Thermoleophilia bacterium]|nr:XRE family transcriptional regulator [Thermoleophilia bacterium]
MAEGVPAHQVSDGNVFADLGLPDADVLLVKARLAQRITEIATRSGMTQAQTARRLGTSQPKVSALFTGKLAGFSIERLLRFVTALDQDVDIRITPKPRRRRRATVSVTADEAESGPRSVRGQGAGRR